MSGGRIEIDVDPNVDGFPGKLQSGLEGATSTATKIGQALGLALGAGVIATGVKKSIEIGVSFDSMLNQIRGTSNATEAQMRQVSETARALGNDLTLPATSASDAASAILELTKGNLELSEAQVAAKGTLQLAAAAQVDAATAATYQADAINTFNLKGADAGRVADILANAANKSTASIDDMAMALSQGGGVASSFNMTIEDTVGALAVMANNGYKGSDAGTLLKSTLIALQDTGKPATAAMKTLGIEVYDQQGKFRGLGTILEQLNTASKSLTEEQFNQASTVLFGSDALRLSMLAAKENAGAFRDAAAAVGEQGAAARLAAEFNSGMPGALEAIQNAAENAGLELYSLIRGPLNELTRGAAAGITQATEDIAGGIRGIVSAFSSGDPRVAFLTDGLRDLQTVGGNLLDGLTPVGAAILDAGRDAGEAGGLVDTATGAVSGLTSTAAALSEVLGPLGSLVGGAVSAFTAIPTPLLAAAAAYAVLRVAQNRYAAGLETRRVNATGDAMNIYGRRIDDNARRLGGLSRATYGVNQTLSQLRTEYRTQEALGTRWGRQMTTSATLAATYRTSTLGAVAATRSFTDQVGAIRAGAAAAGQPVSRLSAAFATLSERSATVNRMGTAYQGAAASAGVFSRAQGVAAGAASGLRSAGAGVVGLFGGPLGLALTGAAIAGGAWATSAARAKGVTDAYKAALAGLAEEQKTTNSLLIQSRGSAGDSVFASLTKQVDLYKDSVESATKSDAKWTDVAKSWFNADDWGKNLSGDTDNDSTSKMDQAASQAKKAKAALDDLGMTSEELGRKIGGGAQEWESFHARLNAGDEGGRAAAASLQGLRDAYVQSQEAARRTSPGFAELQAAVQKFSDTTATAADKSKALSAALDALNPARGKQATLAAYNEQARQVTESLGEATDKAAGFGKELINADGSINSTTTNGGALSSALMGLVDSYNSAASAGNNMDELAAKNNQTIAALALKYGVSAAEIRAAANTLGLSDVDLVVKLSGFGEVTQGLGIVNRQLDALKPGQPRVIEVKADQVTDSTRDVLTKLGFNLSDIEQNGVKTVQIRAITDDAQARLRDILGLVQSTPAGKAINVNAPGGQAVKDLLISMGALVTTDNDKNIVVTSPLAPGVLQLLKDLGVQVTTNNDKTILTRADTAATRTALDNLLKPETKTITVQTIEAAQNQIAANGTGIPYRQDVIDAARGAGRAAGGRVPGFAVGGGVLGGLIGAVRGPGTGTSDSIAAQVPEGSHVFTAAETRAAGGSDAIMRMLGAARTGLANATNRLVGVRLSDGETVAGPDQVAAAGGHNAVLGLRRALLGPRFNLGGMVNVEKVGKANDGLPYITGARDCSMWVSWLVQAAKGQALQRLFTTYTLLGGQTAGLVPGASRSDLLAVGTSQEHMAATVMTDKGPVDTETGGASVPSQVQWGRGAAGAFHPQFTKLYHLPVSLINPAPSADTADPNAKTGDSKDSTTTDSTSSYDSTSSKSSEPQRIEAPKPPKLEDVGAEAARIGIRGLLDTLGLGDSILADPGQSTVGQAAQIAMNTGRYRQEQATAPSKDDDDTSSGSKKRKKKSSEPDPTDPTGMHRLMEYGRFTDDFESTYGVTRDSAVVIALLKYRSERNRKTAKTIDVGALNSTNDRDGIKALMAGGQFTDRFGSTFGQTRDSKLTAALLAERARLGAGGVRRFENGGISPMAAGIAAVVPPNTLRVIGDRQKNDEFFLPDTDEPQHVAMGMEWARRRGFQLVAMHGEGGIAARAAQPAAGVPVGAAAGPTDNSRNYTYSGPPEYADSFFAAARKSERIEAQQNRLRQGTRKGTNIR